MMKEIVSFNQACPNIDFSFELINRNSSYFPHTLAIKVTGNYRNGSAGDIDAKLIKGTMNTAVDIWEPNTVLLDLTDFQYNWGDYIDYIFDGPDRKKPFAIVVGPKCRQALSTLIYGIKSGRDIVDNKDFFDNLDKALERLEMEKTAANTMQPPAGLS